MLPPKNRGGRQLFVGPRGKNKRFSNNLFSLELLEYGLNKPPQLAVVVSKKNAKTAVLRNLVKRRAYSVLSGEIKNIKNGVGIIVFAKGGLENIDFNTLKQSLISLLATTPFYKTNHV